MSRFPVPQPAAALMGVALILGGCSQTLYYQSGKSALQRDRDLTQCEVSARQQAPVSSQLRIAPPRLEERRICKKDGTCVTEKYWVRGEPYTVDPNEDLRDRLRLQCMADKGYRQVSLPSCNRGAPVTISTKMPPLDRAACVTRDADGRLQVATAR